MRGGIALCVTTDLLSEWTDPDTAMEAVGNSLGIFERVASPTRVLTTDRPLRDALYDVLLRLVDGGALEKRACADGRYAFRWRPDLGAVGPDDASALVATHAAPPAPAPAPVAAAAVVTASDAAASADAAFPFWQRMAVQTAPLVLPAVSCVLALLAFLWLDATIALLITAALAVVGLVGVIRRVQFAAFWIVGLVIAGVLVRFS